MSIKNIYEIPTFLRRLLLIIFDSLCLLVAILISLNNNENFSIILYLQFWILSNFIYIFTGHYKSIIRYFDGLFIYKNIFRNILIVFSISVFELIFKQNYLSNINLFLFIIFNILFTYFLRLFIKDFIRSIQSLSIKNKKNTIIFGAGAAGNLLSNYINYTSRYNVLCFVDDNPKLINRQINGISIKNVKELPKLIKNLKIKTLILAIPSLSMTKRKEILLLLQNFNIEILRVPEIEDISLDKSNINKLKSIEIEDLLYREVVKADQNLMDKDIKDSVVCVTGAGGSIGSEICMKIVTLKPKKLIVIEHSEFNLFQLEEKIKLIISDEVEFITFLGDVKDYMLIKKTFEEEKVDIVFHAAAYKHVPIVELNPISCISNNVRTSEIICKVAYQYNVKKVILISSDKAVRPKSIMGATKRLSELIFQAYDEESKNNKKETIFAMVRFGNVLNSSGSVIPKFKKQISQGGPITITDKRMIRYFMTIKEAAELVIQSSSIAKGGEVFLLDMGKPVKILDLARQMIRQSGFTEKSESNKNGDIEIIETGLRDGEKLYEELLIDAESKPTVHELIFCASEKMISFNELNCILEELFSCLDKYKTKRSLEILNTLVPEWSLKKEIKESAFYLKNLFISP